MTLEIIPNETGVHIRVHASQYLRGMSLPWCLEAKWECGNQTFAALMADFMRKEIELSVQKARAEAYADGWRDAKGKRFKRPPETFSTAL